MPTRSARSTVIWTMWSPPPIYVQSVYDAVRFPYERYENRAESQVHTGAAVRLHHQPRHEIRCKKIFDPSQANDCDNLTIDMETGISGATFKRLQRSRRDHRS